MNKEIQLKDAFSATTLARGSSFIAGYGKEARLLNRIVYLSLAKVWHDVDQEATNAIKPVEDFTFDVALWQCAGINV